MILIRLASGKTSSFNGKDPRLNVKRAICFLRRVESLRQAICRIPPEVRQHPMLTEYERIRVASVTAFGKEAKVFENVFVNAKATSWLSCAISSEPMAHYQGRQLKEFFDDVVNIGYRLTYLAKEHYQ